MMMMMMMMMIIITIIIIIISDEHDFSGIPDRSAVNIGASCSTKISLSP